MTTDEEREIERIGEKVDADGDEIPQNHPIENPGENGDGDEADDAIAEPHPHEPGAPDDADDDDQTSQPAED
jgi:hypothetical protein